MEAILASAAPILTAVALLIGALWQGQKVRAEVRLMQRDMTATRTAAETVAHEVKPNSGKSLADAVGRIEIDMQRLKSDIADQGVALMELRADGERTHRRLWERLAKREATEPEPTTAPPAEAPPTTSQQAHPEPVQTCRP